jgi:hypothetical protein
MCDFTRSELDGNAANLATAGKRWTRTGDVTTYNGAVPKMANPTTIVIDSGGPLSPGAPSTLTAELEIEIPDVTGTTTGVATLGEYVPLQDVQLTKLGTISGISQIVGCRFTKAESISYATAVELMTGAGYTLAGPGEYGYRIGYEVRIKALVPILESKVSESGKPFTVFNGYDSFTVVDTDPYGNEVFRASHTLYGPQWNLKTDLRPLRELEWEVSVDYFIKKSYDFDKPEQEKYVRQIHSIKKKIKTSINLPVPEVVATVQKVTDYTTFIMNIGGSTMFPSIGIPTTLPLDRDQTDPAAYDDPKDDSEAQIQAIIDLHAAVLYDDIGNMKLTPEPWQRYPTHLNVIFNATRTGPELKWQIPNFPALRIVDETVPGLVVVPYDFGGTTIV